MTRIRGIKTHGINRETTVNDVFGCDWTWGISQIHLGIMRTWYPGFIGTPSIDRFPVNLTFCWHMSSFLFPLYSPSINGHFRNLNWRYTVIRPKCLGISDTKYGLKNGTLHLCFRVYSPSYPSSQWGNTSRKTLWLSKQKKMLEDFPCFTRFSPTFSG